MASIYSVSNNKLNKLDQNNFKKSGKIWIDINETSKEDIDFILKQIELHPITLEDIQSISTPVKYERFENYLFIVFKGIKGIYDYSVKAYRIYFIITKNMIITVHDSPIAYIEKLKQNDRKLQKLLNDGVDTLMHDILDNEVDRYLPFVRKISREIDQLDDLISQSPKSSSFDSLFGHKSTIQSLRRSISSIKDTFARILRNRIYIRTEILVYFRDVYDNVERLDQLLQSCREQISSTVSEHIAVSSNKMNDIIKVLTMITTLLMPLTLITGLYGMNVPLYGENNRFSLLIIVGFMLLLSGTMIFFFKRKKWL